MSPQPLDESDQQNSQGKSEDAELIEIVVEQLANLFWEQIMDECRHNRIKPKTKRR
jgi:hypothetical protein